MKKRHHILQPKAGQADSSPGVQTGGKGWAARPLDGRQGSTGGFLPGILAITKRVA